MQYFSALVHSVVVIGIHNENDGLSIIEKVSPKWSDSALSAHVPDHKLNVLVGDLFHIETDGWLWIDNLT